MAISFGGLPVVDPITLLDICQQSNVPTEPWYRKVNSFRIPIGEQPGRGFVAMLRSDFDNLDLGSSHTLTFDSGSGAISLQKIEIVRYWNAFGTNSYDDNSIIVLELADRRINFTKTTNTTIFGPTGFSFNAVMPFGYGFNYYTNDPSTGFATPYTWQKMLDRLWNDLFATSAPTLPFTPDGTPNNFNFFNISTWKAINNVLTRLGCSVVYRPDTDVFSIVRLGIAGSIDSAMQDRLEINKVYNSDEDLPDRANVPEKLYVLFPNSQYLISTGLDFNNPPNKSWQPVAALPSPVNANAASGSQVNIEDDLVYNQANTAALNTRAAERAADWSRIYNHYAYHSHYLYTFKDFSPDIFAYLGSQGFEIAFYDFGGGEVCEASAGEMPTWTQLGKEHIAPYQVQPNSYVWPVPSPLSPTMPSPKIDMSRYQNIVGNATVYLTVSNGSSGQIAVALASNPSSYITLSAYVGYTLTPSSGSISGDMPCTVPIYIAGNTGNNNDSIIFVVLTYSGTIVIRAVSATYLLTPAQ